MPPIIPFPHEIPSDNADNENSNEHPPNGVSDSDSFSEEEDYDGYQPLSQDPDNCLDNPSDMDEDSYFLSEEEMMTCGINLPNTLLLPAPAVETITSNQKTDTKKDLRMDEDHIETIKSVMKGITLPKSNLPQWATAVPEEEWKSALLSGMLSRKNKENNFKSYGGETSKKSDSDVAR
ncbi:male-enhanced antigen 1 [Caerostris extrusa]|uniref:Male-enhanced antigen 1 n=1 Tax=Caerostris extrusa TaxID=172846 RepID=A0AAV4VAY2_CAEEX|nr:male-enhanced antigen 1 [Caerostris extrusa]